jgi:hypothetical protein
VNDLHEDCPPWEPSAFWVAANSPLTACEFSWRRGQKGITVKEIAGKLGVGVNRIHTWFYNARKSLMQIKKIGPGKYCWQE